MRGRRPRNRDLELSVANTQAGALGINRADNLDEMVRLIDNKDGDFYKVDLFPDPGARAAYDNMPYTARRSPLQDAIVADMRRYYGVAGTGAPTAGGALQGAMPVLSDADKTIARELISEASQQPAQAQYQSAVARPVKAAVHPVEAAPAPARIEEPVTPQQQAANDLKDDYVNHTVGYDVQKNYDDIISGMEQERAANRQVENMQRMIDERVTELEDGQWMTGNQTGDMALLGGTALLAGGGIGRMMGKGKDEEER